MSTRLHTRRPAPHLVTRAEQRDTIVERFADVVVVAAAALDVLSMALIALYVIGVL